MLTKAFGPFGGAMDVPWMCPTDIQTCQITSCLQGVHYKGGIPKLVYLFKNNKDVDTADSQYLM